ncbi:hypothetical protein, partial [Elioraea sp. Yellowstone]|uniref:hypothetical protein n=1 Tax=Elioraea sp. Yellowstone TaxID=2592070 RepID=UPI001F1AA256
TALLGDAALGEDQDLVGVAPRGGAGGGDERRGGPPTRAPRPRAPRRPQRAGGGAAAAFAAAVAVAAALLVLAQAALPHRAGEARWQAAYVHVAAGFYLDVVANRLARRLLRNPASEPAAWTR